MDDGERAYPESSMSRELIVSREAESELTETHDWYETRSTGLGSEFLLSVDACFNSILRTPQIYPVVYNNLRRALLRRFPYQVFFLEEGERIVVLAVFHGKRNPKHWQKRV